MAPFTDGSDLWDAAEDLGPKPEIETGPDPKAAFDSLPAAASQPKNYAAWSKDLAEWLYRTQTFNLRRCVALGLSAKAGESEGDFNGRVGLAAREARDAAIAALRQKYAAKLDVLAAQEQRATDRIARERARLDQLLGIKGRVSVREEVRT